MQFAHELIVPEVGFPFKLFLFEGREGHYHREKHWHRSIEIFAVCDGELEFKIDEKTWHLTAGEFMIVNSNEVHEVDSPLPNETIVLQIPLKVFEKYYLPNVDLAIERARGFAPSDQLLEKIGSNLGELIELLRKN